jgi:hypothetical protein
MPWSIRQPEPSNLGEPQSVRDAYDKRLQAQAEADALIKELATELEIG